LSIPLCGEPAQDSKFCEVPVRSNFEHWIRFVANPEIFGIR
jgi:hypothetical protein